MRSQLMRHMSPTGQAQRRFSFSTYQIPLVSNIPAAEREKLLALRPYSTIRNIYEEIKNSREVTDRLPKTMIRTQGLSGENECRFVTKDYGQKKVTALVEYKPSTRQITSIKLVELSTFFTQGVLDSLTHASLDMRKWLAHRHLEENPHCSPLDFRYFKFEDEDVRLELANKLAESHPERILNTYNEFRISNQDNGLRIINKFLDHAEAEKTSGHLSAPWEDIVKNIPYHCHRFGIPMQENVAIANRVLDIAPHMYGSGLAVMAMHIDDEAIRTEIAKATLEKCEYAATAPFELFKIFNDENVQYEYFRLSILDQIRYDGELMPERAEQIPLYFRRAEGDPRCSRLSEVAARYGNPALQRLVPGSNSRLDPFVRARMEDWAHYTALNFRDPPQSLIDSHRVNNLFDLIGNWRDPKDRYGLTHYLRNRCLADEPTSSRFFQFDAQFPQAHTRLFSILLFSLVSRGAEFSSFEDLKAILTNRRFRDNAVSKPVIANLINILDDYNFSDQRKCDLISAAVSHEINGLASMPESMKIIDSLIKLSNKLNEPIVSLVNLISTGEKTLLEARTDVFTMLLGSQTWDSDEGKFEKLVANIEQSRSPNALLSYAAELFTNQEEEDTAPVLDMLKRFVRTTYLSDDLEEFTRTRYDVTASEHLRLIAEAAPDAFNAWQQQASLPSTQEGNGPRLAIIDSASPEDLFLCGAETLSCQSPFDSASSNKGLMAYVLDGKYRILTCKGQDGTTRARRMLRLLWDEESRQPVLHLEKLYSRAGVSDNDKAALLSLAKEKAKSMHCRLLTNDRSVLRDLGILEQDEQLSHPNPVLSYPTPLPFEYLDFRYGIVKGNEGYTVSHSFSVPLDD